MLKSISGCKTAGNSKWLILSHGDGDGIVNHSIASGVPEKAPYEMINQFFHVFFSKATLLPQHTKSYESLLTDLF